jgi:tRNA threonylcarbamoyladenosine biosynthesis protein TsaE
MLIDSFKSITKNNVETEQLGYDFSKKISKGDIIALNGNLGSGKTTFVKGVLKGLNYQYEVTSPTYTLINEYNADYNIIHIDCYREKDVNRWLNIGLVDYFLEDNILFIEWSKNIKSILPKDINNISFKIASLNERLIKCNE